MTDPLIPVEIVGCFFFIDIMNCARTNAANMSMLSDVMFSIHFDFKDNLSLLTQLIHIQRRVL